MNEKMCNYLNKVSKYDMQLWIMTFIPLPRRREEESYAEEINVFPLMGIFCLSSARSALLPELNEKLVVKILYK